MSQDEEIPYGRRVIKGEELLVLLRRVETGEKVNIVFADAWGSLPELLTATEMLESK